MTEKKNGASLGDAEMHSSVSPHDMIAVSKYIPPEVKKFIAVLSRLLGQSGFIT